MESYLPKPDKPEKPENHPMVVEPPDIRKKYS
jgi:hypothetical protein